MDRLLGFLGVLVVLGAAYIIGLRYALFRLRRQLQTRRREQARQPLSLSMMDGELNRLVAEINRCLIAEQRTAERSVRHEAQFKDLMMSVSHDLRTPLTAIRGNLQLLENTDLADSQRHRLAIVNRQTSELSTLVEHFWVYAYYSMVEPELEMERLNLTNLVAECIVEYVPQFEARGLCVHYKPGAAIYVHAERECTVRIMQNLLGNCVRHATGDAYVSIATANEKVILTLANPVTNAHDFDVSHIFDRFYTADASRNKPSGLGLTIVKLLIEKMGGHVSAACDGDEIEFQICFDASAL